MPELASQVLFGASGMLGRAMRPLLEARGALLAPSHAEVDVCERRAVERAIPAGATLVVNCSAYTDVDGAERHEAAATRLNADAVEHMARRCKAVGAVLLHFSTDYVFSGDARSPYPVDAPRRPLNAYGRSKAAGEEALEASGAEYLCVRTSWLYAPWGKNFVLTMASLAREREELKVVDDQRGRPTSCVQLARASLSLIEAGARGLAHVTDGGECSWFELAGHVIERTHPRTRVLPCSSEEFPRPAPRPRYSVLDLCDTEAVLGPLRAWRDMVDDTLEQIGAASGPQPTP